MVIFDSAIKVASVKEFYKDITDEIDRIPEDSNEKVDVHFTTNGGLKYLVPVIYGILNKYEDNIRIILTMEMSSAGFDLLYLLRKKEVFVGPEFTFSMTHKGYQSFDAQNDFFLKTITEHMSNDLNDWKKRYKSIGFTKEEIKSFTRGDDVYFDRKRTLQLFPNIKEINYYN